MKRAIVMVWILALVAAPAFAQKKKDKDKRGFVWDDRPTIVFGKNINVEFKGRALVEWRAFDPDQGEDLFHLRTARLGLKGKLTKHLSWEAEREVTGDDLSHIKAGDWKDVNVEWKTFRAFTARGGRFKMPFGMEQTTGISDRVFFFNDTATTEIAPARDKGGMISGDLRHFTYEAGVFHGDGDNGKSNEPQFVASGQKADQVGPSVAIRAVGDLFRPLPLGKLRSANVGIAYTVADVPEGLNSLRAETVWGSNITKRVYVKGRRQRYGTQFEWTPGSASIKAEWMQSREQRKEQSNRDQDLSDYIGTAWYVTGTWFITGEKKENNIKVKHPLYKGGPGAIEVAARIEQLSFRSASTAGPAFTNPRADHLLPNSDTVFTVGINWTTSPWTRILINAIHEDIEDPYRSPVSGTTAFWSGVLRLNIVF